MVSFKHTVHSEEGIHAMSAVYLANALKPYHSRITITKGERGSDSDDMIGLMKLGVIGGDELLITLEGETEAEELPAVQKLLEEYL